MRGIELGESCHYCGRRVFPHKSPEARRDKWCQSTRDHYLPRMMTPKGVPRATIVACLACNTMKAYHPPEVFTAFIRERAGTAPIQVLAKQFQQFVYELARFGLFVAKTYAIENRRVMPANDQGQPRDAKGRFAKRTA